MTRRARPCRGRGRHWPTAPIWPPARFDAAEAARAAAYLITNSESAAFHLDRLRHRAGDFDPDTRDRFLAGALLPAAWVSRAQRVRQWCLDQALALFGQHDLLLAPGHALRRPPRSGPSGCGSAGAMWRCGPIWVCWRSLFPASACRW
jgi:Asp-tRNA(Asn)/Glu-tRNA(Gln) amidotransferase A subunit family amidase